MKTKTLKEAIKESVETFIELDAHFSIFQITDDIRTAVNDDVYMIEGIDLEYVEVAPMDVKYTQPINHDDVKSKFMELHGNGEFNLERHFNGKFNEYYPTKDQTTVNALGGQVIGHKPSVTISKDKIKDAVKTVVSQRKSNHTIMTFDKIENYLSNRDNGEATLKQIQSRFKGVPKTCQEILDMIENEIDRFDLKCYEIKRGNTLSKTIVKLL